MTVFLRPHHLLCMLTYVGKGYTPAFVSGYDAIIARLNAGETIVLQCGPDDICKPMLGLQSCHCHNDTVRKRDAAALHSISDSLGRTLETGQSLELDANDVGRLRIAFRAGSVRTACAGCEWYALCGRIAGNDFKGCYLFPEQ